MQSNDFQGPVSVAPVKGKNKAKVAVLGAGISGLSTAYELERAGYDVVIIEASFRAGGRNMTVRHGDKIDEMGHTRYCQFDQDENLYFNCGPARIPGHHKRLLHYCRALNVPLQIKANSNQLAYIQDEKINGGKPIRQVDYRADANGFLSEMMSKSIDKGAFEQQLSEEDTENFLSYLKAFGSLNEKGKYTGSDRAGSQRDRMLFPPTPKAPMPLHDVFKSDVWRGVSFASQIYDWVEPLMEVKGGMDGIVKGFLRNISSPVELNAQVRKIHNLSDGVEIAYEQAGKLNTIKVDYCFNNIPAYFMAGIENNLSPDYLNALNKFKRGHLFKIGFQMRERFWEKEGIYGGITYTSQDNAQLWYPSHDIHAAKGVMLGAYCWDEKQCARFEAMTPEQRFKYAAQCGENIHPGYSGYIENAVSIPWARMNNQMGCGIHMEKEDWEHCLPILQKPDGRHFMIGDQISQHSGWQEGALAASQQALSQFNQLQASITSSHGAAYVS
ncbi:FAD-dependent oxidoreductase [Neptunicella marina]|uniref:Tryptophan 2-monooxygenase n=2 Tax=Neptunicella marina TaxID=2125989 RepID=A0A8J6IWA8_9ALTE|nr:FAD-dependent oxidoreductase [Neptunicella marina]